MNNSDKTDLLLAKYFSNEPMPISEKEELDNWIRANQEEFLQLETLMHKMRGEEINEAVPFCFDTSLAWNKVEKQLVTQGKVVKRHHLFSVLGIAASLLLIVALSLFFFNESTPSMLHYANVTPQSMQIVLPDSSQVQLYPHSSLDYLVAKQKREVKLKGKAFFDVKKVQGSSFEITAEEMTITVVGTSFLVDAFSDSDAAVFVKNGIVRVDAEQESLLLKANQQVQISDGRMVRDTIVNPALFQIGITPPVLVFEKERLDGVVDQLETLFSVRIEIPESVRGNLITTRFETTSLAEILQELSYLCNCTYQKDSNGIYILIEKEIND
ncbi:MAG: FecR family protein [Bacteroidales bacterium]